MYLVGSRDKSTDRCSNVGTVILGESIKKECLEVPVSVTTRLSSSRPCLWTAMMRRRVVKLINEWYSRDGEWT